MPIADSRGVAPIGGVDDDREVVQGQWREGHARVDRSRNAIRLVAVLKRPARIAGARPNRRESPSIARAGAATARAIAEEVDLVGGLGKRREAAVEPEIEADSVDPTGAHV